MCEFYLTTFMILYGMNYKTLAEVPGVARVWDKKATSFGQML